MSTPRRSRMHRTRTGKRLMLTERDLEIFRWLGRYRYLRSTYLHAFAGGASETRFKERLGDLFHEGYLDRSDAQWRFADCLHTPAIYELGKGGREALAEAGISGDERRVLLGKGAHRQFAHSLMICEVLASIELATMNNASLRFIPLPEILAKAPETTRTAAFPLRIPVGSADGGCVVPDAAFGLEYRTAPRLSYRFFALEADHGTMPISRTAGMGTSYHAKLAAYTTLIARQLQKVHLGIPNLLVLTVTTDDARIDAMTRCLSEQTASGAFLFAAVRDATRPLPSLLNASWKRGGHQLLAITNP